MPSEPKRCGPKRKVSPDRAAFLDSQIERFLALKDRRTFSTFWLSLYKEYFSRYPVCNDLIAEGKLPAEDATIQLPPDIVDAIIGKEIEGVKSVNHTLLHLLIS